MSYFHNNNWVEKAQDSKRNVQSSYIVEATSDYTSPTPSKSKRIKREPLFTILALVMVVCIMVFSFYSVVRASKYINYDDVVNFTKQTCVITDRFGQPIYSEGNAVSYKAFGNLIGHKENIHNSLLFKHSDSLRPGGVNPVFGYRTLEKEPRIMQTTLLSNESQQELIKLFGSASGCCFAYNYETGDIYTALSFPAYIPGNANASYINRCLSSVYIPGSTMKMVTAALAVDQGKNVEKLKYTCNKKYKLSDGNEIVCTGNHGTIGFSTAIAKSCNCYFAQLIQDLNLEKALKTLKELGFSVNGVETEKELIDELSKVSSSTNVTNTASFKNIWGLIGQGHSQVNPIDMARIAAAIVNEGKAAQPHFISSITNPSNEDEVIWQPKTEMKKLLSKNTATKTAKYWKAGVDSYYYAHKGMSQKIDYAKTGTAQRQSGKEDKLLVGVVESAKTAFYIVVEEGGAADTMKIANKLAELLPTN